MGVVSGLMEYNHSHSDFSDGVVAKPTHSSSMDPELWTVVVLETGYLGLCVGCSRISPEGQA
jgi:hypothetical protein